MLRTSGCFLPTRAVEAAKGRQGKAWGHISLNRMKKSYTTEDFEHDIAVYTAHIERTMRNLKIVGVAPRDQKADPEISGIFVPLLIVPDEQPTLAKSSPTTSDEQTTPAKPFPAALVAALEEISYLVILGGPGSGKSTATKHLAWSHAIVNQSSVSALTHTPLLSRNPLPLRIELRRFNEERQRKKRLFLVFGESGSKMQVKGQYTKLLKFKTVIGHFKFLNTSPNTKNTH